MKRILLSLFLLAGAMVASAQCTPDPGVTSGMSPDTLQGMDPAYVGQPYQQDFTFVVPFDTTTSQGTFYFDRVELDDVEGLPTEGNFTYQCNPSNCTFPGNSTKCVRLYSTTDPTLPQVGTHPITIVATAYVSFTPGGIAFQAPGSPTRYDGYYLVIDEPASVSGSSLQQVSNGEMKSLIAYPNPTSGNTTIEYAMGYNSAVNFTVTNLLGEVIEKRTLGAVKGLNRIEFNASDLSNGVYLYAITDGRNTISKKLIVNK